MFITSRHNTGKKGFTLVEISIVMVIIALIIAAVASGKNLMRSAGLRRVVIDMNTLKSSVNAFKLKYEQYPGDFDSAFSIWSTNCAATAAACNGDGNGKIRAGGSGFKEEFIAFKHLQLAGLISGSYTGIYTNPPVAGVNVPKGPFKNSGYSLAHMNLSEYGGWNSSSIGNWIVFGTPAGDIMRSAVVTPTELYFMDLKADDGLPYSGIIQTETIYSGSCTVAATAPTTYLKTTTTNACSIRYDL